jgi:hypothetical protein
MISNPEQLGPDDQTARLNSGGDAIAAMKAAQADEERDIGSKWKEQALNQLKRLGVATLYEDIPDNSPVLASGLAKISAAGALDPIKETVVVANQGGNWTFDLYHFPKYLSPGIRFSANEALLALSPDSVIASLRDGGFIGPR